jgi:hypothetical protein
MRDDEADRSLVFDAKQLSDDELIGRLKRCVAHDRQLTARLLEHFGEVNARGLYRDQGYPSMFHYAVHALHMSESEAGLRIRVSRLGREFPEALRMLARGELHLTALLVLAPVLTHGNVGLLHEARFKTKLQVLELRAKHFPQPDARAQIRKLRRAAMPVHARPAAVPAMPSDLANAIPSQDGAPARVGPTSPAMAVHSAPATVQTMPSALANVIPSQGGAPARIEPTSPAMAVHSATAIQTVQTVPSGLAKASPLHGSDAVPAQDTDEHSKLTAAGEATPLLAAPTPADATAELGSLNCRAPDHDAVEPAELATSIEATQPIAAPTRAGAAAEFRLESPRPVVVIPLSEGRYLVQFTADQSMHDKLAQAQELMRNVVRRGDFVAVFDRALDLLIADRKKKLFGLRTGARSSCVSAPVAPARSDLTNDAARAPATPVAVSVENGVSDELHRAVLDEDSAKQLHEPSAEHTREVSAERTAEISAKRTPEISATQTRQSSAEHTPEIDAEHAPEVSAEPTPEISAERTHESSAEHTHESSATRTHEISAERTNESSATRTNEIGAERTNESSAERTNENSATRTNESSATRTRESSPTRTHESSATRTGESSAERLHAASTKRRREDNAPDQSESERSTYIPRAVRREVMARDGYQCTFVGPQGNRCPERGRLQLDHFPVPSSCHGPATSANLRVRCAVHNALAAEKFFGRAWVLQKIAAARAGVAVSQDETAPGPGCPDRVVDVGTRRGQTPRTLPEECTSSLPHAWPERRRQPRD